uniref:Uncharacterized protein n=1 Tax=Cannabis sativa TaxID=3483 RepID=A0A803QRW9_CANSA
IPICESRSQDLDPCHDSGAVLVGGPQSHFKFGLRSRSVSAGSGPLFCVWVWVHVQSEGLDPCQCWGQGWVPNQAPLQ